MSRQQETQNEPEPWADLLGRVVRHRSAASFLGIGSGTLSARREAALVLGVRLNDRSWVYPVAQFARVGRHVEVLNGLGEVLPVLLAASDGLAVARWMGTPNRLVDGITPWEYLQRGNDRARLLDAARQQAELWAPRELTQSEWDLFESVGVHRPVSRSSQRATFTASWSDLVSSSLTVAQVAKVVSRSRSTICRWIAERHLYAFRLLGSQQWLIPRWQIHDGRLVPGLASALPHLPPGLHPLSVQGLLTIPKPDLVNATGDGVSPLEWLLDGGDPAAAGAAISQAAVY